MNNKVFCLTLMLCATLMCGLLVTPVAKAVDIKNVQYRLTPQVFDALMSLSVFRASHPCRENAIGVITKKMRLEDVGLDEVVASYGQTPGTKELLGKYGVSARDVVAGNVAIGLAAIRIRAGQLEGSPRGEQLSKLMGPPTVIDSHNVTFLKNHRKGLQETAEEVQRIKRSVGGCSSQK